MEPIMNFRIEDTDTYRISGGFRSHNFINFYVKKRILLLFMIHIN